MNKNKKFFIAILSMFLFSSQIVGCSKSNNIENNSNEDKTNALIGKTKQYSVEKISKIENTDEVLYINKITNRDIISPIYKQKIVYEHADLVKIVINKLAEDEKLELNKFSYLDIQFHPKLDIVYNNVKLVQNNEGKNDIFGEIVINDNNLEDFEKDYYKYYYKNYPDKIEYENNIIKIKFNK